MATFQELLDQAATAQVPATTPFENTITGKKLAVEQASTQRRDALIAARGELGLDMYQVAAGMGNQAGAGSMTPLESDIRSLSPTQFAQKYGPEVAQRVYNELNQSQQRLLRDQTQTGSDTETLYDLGSGVVGGFAGSIADIAAFGVGLVNDEFGAAMANQTSEYRQMLEESQSDALNAARRVNRAKNALTQRDNQLQYDLNIANGASETEAGFERFLADFGDTITNLDDSRLFAQGTAEGVGSLLVAGPLTKGMKAGAELALGGRGAIQLAKDSIALGESAGVAIPTSLRATALLDKAALPAAIGTMEAGGTYSQTTNEIMSMQPEQLLQTSEEYRQKVAEYEAQGMLREEALHKAQVQLASETGIEAAATQFPTAAAAGLLTRYAEAPFKAASAKQALANIASEPVEEGIQGATGQMSQNLAIQQNVDASRSLTEGAGEQSAAGAVYGLGTGAVVQGPALAVKGTGAAVKGAVTAVGSKLTEMAQKSTNERNTQINTETIQEANAAVSTASADAEEIAKAVDSVDATPEQKEQAKVDVSSLQQALNIDPNTDLEDVPENLKPIIQGSRSRAEAIINVAQELKNIENDNQFLQIGAVLNNLLSAFDDLKAKNNEVLAALPADDPAHQKYQNNLALIEKLRTNPAVKTAVDAIQEHIDKHAAEMKPVSETSLESSEGKQQVQDVVTVATLAPNKGNLDAVNQVLQHHENGKVPLNDFQIKALQNSKALLTAAKELAEQKKANGLNRVRDVVSDEILSRNDTKDKAPESEKRSALEFTQRVYHAYKAGDYEAAAAHLQEFGMFVQHLKHKIDAINTHYEKGAKVGILNRDKEDYQALLPPEFSGGRIGFESAKALGLPGVMAMPTQADKVDLIQSMALEAEAVTNIYNSLVDGYNLEGVEPIEPSSLDSELVGKPDEVVARYKASLNVRQGGKPKTAPVQKNEATPQTEEKAPDPRSKDLEQRLEAVKEYIPAAYKGVQKLIAEGKLDQAEAWIKQGEQRAEAATQEKQTSPEPVAETANVTEPVTKEVPAPTQTESAPESKVELVAQEQQTETKPAQETPVVEQTVPQQEQVNTQPDIVDNTQTVEEINTDGLIEPDFTGPEQPTTLMSYFKDLLSHATKRFTNYFHKSFVLPEDGKQTSRLLGNDSPIEYVSQLLFGSKEQLEQTLGHALKYDLTNAVKTAYEKFLSTDGKNPQSFGGILAAVNKSLESWLNEPNSKKDPRTRGQMLAEGVALHTLKTGHALNIVENKDGKYSYNQELIEGAVLAAMQWLIEASNREVILKDDEIKKLTGQDIEDVSEDIIAQLKKSGFGADQIKMAITNKIKAYWGVRVAPGALQGYSDGIPEAVAAEILEALVKTGFLKENTVKLRIPQFDEENNPILDEEGKQVIDAKNINRYEAVPVDEALKGYPTAIEDIAVTEPEQVIYLHDDEVPVAKTRMNNPQERNTKEQERAIEISQRNKFFLNTHTVDAILALGEQGVAYLFGGGVTNLEDKPWLNKNHKASIEGKNKTTVAAFNALNSLLYQMNSRAIALGMPITDLAIRYAVNASKNGRLFMLGSYNPQASKLMRAAVGTTWSTLDLSNPTHMSNFKLALAQALGVKVHNLVLDESIKKVDALFGKLEPAITRFQTFLENKENGLDFEALAQDFKNAGAPMTPAAFNAVLEWARSRMSDTDTSAFRTAVSLEADGITNGPINSIMLLTQGRFTPEFIKNLLRGGISFSNGKSMAQLRLDHNLIDLYSESANAAQEAVYDSIESFKNNREVAAHQRALIRTMRTLLPNLNYTFENGKLELQFERGLLKNPLTITIYGSSANGIAGKVVGEILDAYYEKLSQASDRFANGVKDAEGNYIRPATIAEAMFPELSAEEAQKVFDRLQEDFDVLTHSGVKMAYEYGKKVYSIGSVLKRSNTQTAQEFTVTPEQFSVLRSTMLHTFIEPMVEGIDKTLGTGLTKTVDQIKTISQIQSSIYAQMFRNELDRLIQEREAEYKAKGETWKQNGFVSKEDVRAIVKKLNRFAPMLRTGKQTFTLGKTQKLDAQNYAYSESLRGRFATSPNMNLPADAGVGAIPATAIGFGDAYMIQDAVLSEILDRVLAVFDGVEMPLDKINEFSTQLNKSVYESYKANPMENFLTMFNTFLEGKEQIEETLLEEVALNTGKHASKIKFDSPLLFTLLKTLRKQPGMTFDMFKEDSYISPALVPIIMRAIEAQRTFLAKTAEDISIRHQVMQEVGMSVDQMAGAAAPYYNEKPLLNTTNPEEIAKILDARYQELKELAKTKEEPATPKSETSELGEEHPSGARVLTWNTIQKLASFLGLSKDQQVMYDEIVKAHAGSGIVVVTGSKTQIAKYRLEAGIPALGNEDNPTGEFVIASDGTPTIFLYQSKAETLVHELIHAATFQTMLAYYEGKIKKNTVAGKAMQNLEALMKEFLAEFKVGKDENVNNVLAAIANIQNDMSKPDHVKQAMILNEFVAWTLANQKLAIKLRHKDVSSKLLVMGQKVLSYLRNLLGLSEKNTFLNNLQFNTAVIIHAAPTLREQYNEIVLQHNPNPTQNPRLTRIREALIDNVVNHVSKLYGAKEVIVGNPNASDLVESTKYSNYVADVFGLSNEERLTFATFVIAMTTQGKLDSSILVRAQELYLHVLKDLDAAKLASPTTTDQQARESEGLPKLNILLGKAGFTDKADRTVLLSTFLGLAVVSEDFRNILARTPVPKTEKIPGKTINAMAENLGNQMMDGLSKVLTGEKNSASVKNAIDNLADQLHLLTFHEQGRFEGTVAKVGNMINQGNDWVVEKKDALAEKGTALGKRLMDSSNNVGTRFVGASIRAASGLASSKEANEQAEGIIENLNKLDFRFGKRTIIDVIGRTEKNASIYDLIKPVRSLVQQIRQQFREHIPQYIAGKFSKVITPEQYASMFRSLGKTDIAVLLSSMSVDNVVALFQSNAALNEQIANFEEEIQAIDPANWLLLEKKMKQLANYMNTGVTGNKLLRNAEAIANLLGEPTKGVRVVDAKLISAVDQLVSLYAIKELPQKDKSTMLSLAQQEPVGVKFIVDYLATQRKEELNKLDFVTRFNYFKGYIPSDPKEQGDVIVADNNKAAELAVYGYVQIGTYKSHPNDPVKTPRSYYYSPVAQKAIVSQGIIQNVRHTVAGVDATHGFSTGKTAGRIVDPLQVSRIAKGLRDTNNVENLMPLYNGDGVLFAFERSIDPKMLKNLEQSEHIAKMIGVWRGRQVEEIESEKMNKKLVAVLKERWDAASVSERDQFVNLDDPRELTKTEREAVKLFSSSMKMLIKDTFGDEGFYVPKDMLTDVIGYRNASVGDFITGNTEWNAETQKAVRTVMLAAFGDKAFKIFVNSEQRVQSVMTDARQTIVVKSVIIPMYNIMSNMLHLVSRGVPVQMILKGSLQKVSEINHYTKSKLRQTELEADIRAEKNDLKRRRLEVELQAIKDSHTRMSIWPLIQAGEFSTIADVGMTAEDLELTSGKLSEWVEKKIDKLPPALQTAAKYGYVSRDTALFKGLQKSVQYGDFVAKAVLFDHLMKNKGKSQEEALAQITEEFVNYDRLPGRARGALENMGLLWFYNYKLRTIKVALSVLRNNPLHAFIAMNLPVPDSVGTVESDNLLGVAADGNLSYSVGPGMALHAINLNPAVNLLN